MLKYHGLFGQNIYSLNNCFSFSEQQGERARRVAVEKRASEGGYGAVLRNITLSGR